MKNTRVFVLLFLFRCLITNAQPVFTATGLNPVAGDTYTMAYVNVIPPGAAGPNKVWDMSSAYSVHSTSLSFVSPLSTPAASLFPQATICQLRGGVYTYYEASSMLMQFQGQANLNGNIFYQDPFDERRYPMTFNDVYTDTWSESNSNVSSAGTFTVTYDAFGTLIIPTGLSTTQTTTLNNVMRVHQYSEYTQTVGSVTSNKTYDFYYWFVDGIHHPVAYTYVSAQQPNLSFTEFMIGISSVNIPEYHDLSVIVYPNPVNDFLNFKADFAANVVSVKCFDITGALKLESDHDPSFIRDKHISLAELVSGLYFVEIRTGDGSLYSGRILKE